MTAEPDELNPLGQQHRRLRGAFPYSGSIRRVSALQAALMLCAACGTEKGELGVGSSQANPEPDDDAQQNDPAPALQAPSVEGGPALPVQPSSVDDPALRDAAPTAGQCRSDDDCRDTEACLGTVVEVEPASGELCSADEQCMDGMTCHWVNTREQRCGPPCSSDADCPSSGQLFECVQQRCGYRSCNDAAPCPKHFQCEVTADGCITIFCARSGCDSEGSCDDGLCVNRKCYDIPGECVER